MQALKSLVFVFYSLSCYEFGHSTAISTSAHRGNGPAKWEPAYSKKPQTALPALQLLRLPMRRQTSQAKIKSTEQFLNFKCKNCNGEFASGRAYEAHRSHRSSQGTPCSDGSSKTEITFTLRAGLTTGILKQHSLAKLGESLQIIQINHIIIK